VIDLARIDLSLLVQDVAQTDVRGGERRIERNGLPVLGDRLGQAALLLVGIGQVVVDLSEDRLLPTWRVPP
jgi:hypothetical protein